MSEARPNSGVASTSAGPELSTPHRAAAVALVAAAFGGALRWLAGELPDATERLYSRELFPLVRAVLTGVSGWLPISLGELTLVAFALFVLVRSVLAVRALVRGEGEWRKLAVRCIARSLTLAGWLYVAYLLAWGFNYARLPYASGTTLELRPAQVDELAAATREFAERAAQLREELPEDPAGVVLIERDWQRHWESIAAAWEAAAREDARLAGPRPSLRATLLSPLMTAAGIAGIYWPFTAEPHVNVEAHPVQVLFSACHEVAHARGFAREDEANYLAWRVASRSGQRTLAYAGALMAFRHLHSQLMAADPARGVEVYEHVSKSVLRDWTAVDAFWRATSKVQRSVRKLSSTVNDTYLKSQGQKLGVRSYGRMVDLILAERRQRAAEALTRPNSGR